MALLLFGVMGIAACREESVSPPSGEPAPPAATPQPPPSSLPPSTATLETTTMTKTRRPQVPRAPAQPAITSFAVYTLSRAKGVPPEARQALRQVVEIAEEDRRQGIKVTVVTTRIGIEGEMRTCISYEEAQAGSRAYQRARAIVKDVDLVNLAVEPCAESATSKEEKES